jgi:methionyl-tRNA formyltransferase
LDAGDIVVQEALNIEPGERADSLTGRLAQLGANTLLLALDMVATGRATCTAQDEAQATFAPKLTKRHGWIDWQAPAEMIERLVRATTPWPGAMTIWQGRQLRIWTASAGQATGRETRPGTVVRVSPDAMTVATGQGALEVTEVQPAGRRRMSVRDFLSGHRIELGDRFGAGDRG